MNLSNIDICGIIALSVVGLVICGFLYFLVFLPLGKLVQGDYRIVERKLLNGSKYIVQRKCFDIWKDESYFTGTDEWAGYGDFNTLKEAENYIAWQKGEKERVVSS